MRLVTIWMTALLFTAPSVSSSVCMDWCSDNLVCTWVCGDIPAWKNRLTALESQLQTVQTLLDQVTSVRLIGETPTNDCVQLTVAYEAQLHQQISALDECTQESIAYQLQSQVGGVQKQQLASRIVLLYCSWLVGVICFGIRQLS